MSDELNEPQRAKMDRYLDLLIEANQRMNLTRIVDRDRAWVQHIGDSLTLLPFVPGGTFRLADVGSGGGAPGIPLAIARPDARVTLIEATQKKAAFLRDAVDQLALSNVTVIAQRVETAGHDPILREQFDIVAARAVATLVWLAEWCLPLAKVGGKVLAMKGPKAHDELPDAVRVIAKLGGKNPTLHPVHLAGADGHLIVAIEKTARTDRRFPRDPTIAKGKPI